MKKVLISAALLALMACTASAAGLNLAWTECVGGGGASNDAFACNNNTTVHILVGSYFAPAGNTAVNGNQQVVDLQTSAATLSPWWNMGTAAGCPGRTLTPSAGFDFTAGPFGCFDYWAGQASGGISYTPGLPAPNRARISMICAIQEALAGPIDPNTETYSFKVTISSARTVGTGACAGCTDAACIVLNSILITQNPGLPTYNVTNPAVTNIARWRGGLADCSVTPAKNTTWGSVKALYR